jgi:hypothetical protein
LTIVPSINAILEAKIVAASIHGPAFAVHGAPALPDVIDISSHGVFTNVLKGKFATPGRPIQIREFPLALKIAGTQPGPGALSCAQRQIETNILIARESNVADVELTEFGGGGGHRKQQR